jgi:hypothetical protein
VLQIGANGASGQELQIAPKNRFHTNLLDKGNFINFHSALSIACFRFSFLRKLWTYHFLFSPWKLNGFA